MENLKVIQLGGWGTCVDVCSRRVMLFIQKPASDYNASRLHKDQVFVDKKEQFGICGSNCTELLGFSSLATLQARAPRKLERKQ